MEDQLARLQQERDELLSQLQAAATEQADLDRRFDIHCILSDCGLQGSDKMRSAFRQSSNVDGSACNGPIG